MAIKEKRPNGDTGARKELPQPIQTEVSGEIAGEKGTSWQGEIAIKQDCEYVQYIET